MKQQLIILSAIGAASLFSGCSSIQGLTGKKQQQTATPAKTEQQAPQAAPDNQVRSLSGRWIISSVGNTHVKGYEDEWPYLEFSDSEGRFYGSDACNIINGSFTVEPGQKLTFSQVASTMRFCPDDTLAMPINIALDTTRSFSISRKGGSEVLSLNNEQNITVMTLRNPDIIFLNGPWQVAAIGKTHVSNPDVRLVFDVTEGLVHGNTGCNLLNGSITQDPQVTSSVQFSALATTRMACPPGDNTEQQLLIALEETATARRAEGDPDRVELLSASGKVLITLNRLDKSDL